MLRVAFYGVTRKAGTSANKAAVEAGLLCYRAELARTGDGLGRTETVTLTDCGNRTRAGAWIDACDLLALNLSVPCRELDEAYLWQFLVRKNVIFLVSKYNPGQSEELEKLSKHYRIDRSRICAIPYNPRFIKAYENHAVPAFLAGSGPGSRVYGDLEFQQSVKRAVGAVIHYVCRKGELYYG